MTSLLITPPFKVWPDVDGEPLEDGFIYIGEAGLNPQTNPISVFFDLSLSIPAAQPLRTIGGYISNSGTPANIYTSNARVSITVRNKNGTLVYSNLNASVNDFSVFELDSVEDLINSSGLSSYGEIKLRSYYSVSYPDLVGSIGGRTVHVTGATNVAPSVGAPVSPSTIGTGVQQGFYYDADGTEWRDTFGVDSAFAHTWYVDASLGSDTTGNGTLGAPYATIQKAFDMMPNAKHQQSIQLADGIYNTNYLDPSRSVEMPRPAILFARAKFIANRTQKNGTSLEGGVVIKGNPSNPENVIIECNDTWTYGIYSAQGQVAIQDLHIRTNAAATNVNNLLTSHRAGSYVHCLNVSLDGFDSAVTAIGILTEGGGNLEFTTNTDAVTIENCNILATAASKGDNLTISGNFSMSDCDTAINVANGSRVDLVASGLTGQSISNCASFAINAQSNSYVRSNGADDANHILIDGDVRLYHGAVLELIFSDIDGVTEIVNGSKAYFNNSDFQNQVLVDAGDVWFSNADSFISPAVANDAVKPVLLRSGGRMYQEGTNNFAGSSGDSAHVLNVLEQTITANASTINVTWQHDAVRLSAGSDFDACVLASGTVEMQTIDIFNYGGPYVEIVEGGVASIQGNAILLSGAAAANEFSGIRMIWINGAWREICRSAAGA